MQVSILDAIPIWGLPAIAVALLAAGVEAGYRYGRWRHARRPDEKDQPVGAMVGSTLGLLALVLGFTFSMAAGQFEARRQAVLEEANAVGTTYLRARLLPDPQRSEVEKLLREYVDVRIAGVRDGNIEEALARSEAIHELLWNQASTAAQKNPNSVMVGVFIQSLNNVIDLHEKRIHVGIRTRIPLVIWVCLIGMAMCSMAAVGYQSGLSGTIRSPAMLGLVLTFSVVLFLIADLDRNQEGLLRVSQQSLINVQRTMQKTTAR